MLITNQKITIIRLIEKSQQYFIKSPLKIAKRITHLLKLKLDIFGKKLNHVEIFRPQSTTNQNKGSGKIRYFDDSKNTSKS